MKPILTVAAAAALALLAGRAEAQYYPYGSLSRGPFTNGGAYAPAIPQTVPQLPTYNPPQTWTGMNLGGGISTFQGSRGGSFNCINLGNIVSCQ